MKVIPNDNNLNKSSTSDNSSENLSEFKKKTDESEPILEHSPEVVNEFTRE